MKVYFTSDTHWGHKRIIEHSHRPFSSVEEMDDILIQNWNKVVRPNDTIYHLGDFNFRSIRTTDDYLTYLNGHIHIVWGNHDDQFAKKYKHRFASYCDAKYLRLNGEKITLYHYPQRAWRFSQHGGWHLFGHCHGSLPNLGRSMDVGVDCWNYTPASFEEIEAYMVKQEVTLHHPVKV